MLCVPNADIKRDTTTRQKENEFPINWPRVSSFPKGRQQDRAKTQPGISENSLTYCFMSLQGDKSSQIKSVTFSSSTDIIQCKEKLTPTPSPHPPTLFIDDKICRKKFAAQEDLCLKSCHTAADYLLFSVFILVTLSLYSGMQNCETTVTTVIPKILLTN